MAGCSTSLVLTKISATARDSSWGQRIQRLTMGTGHLRPEGASAEMNGICRIIRGDGGPRSKIAPAPTIVLRIR